MGACSGIGDEHDREFADYDNAFGDQDRSPCAERRCRGAATPCVMFPFPIAYRLPHPLPSRAPGDQAADPAPGPGANPRSTGGDLMACLGNQELSNHTIR